MNPYIELLRPNVCVLSALGIIVGAIVVGVITNVLVIPAILAAFIITGAGNIINDYFDYEIDKINQPRRPIASGRITKQKAMHYFVLVNIIGLVIAAFVSPSFFIIALINSIVLFFYSRNFKPVAIVGNILVAWLAASTFLAAGLILGTFTTLPLTIIIFSLIAFFGTFAREIFKDIEDIQGDKKAGARTLPIRIGASRSRTVGSILLVLAILSLFTPFFYNILSLFYWIGALPAIILSLYAIVIVSPRKSQKMIKFAMFLVMLGFILGAVL